MPTPDNSIRYPLGGPTVSGTAVTVDFLLQDTKRITRLLSSLVLQGYYIDRIFSPAGDIQGGAVEYEQITSNDLFANRDVQRVEPGSEFPIVGFDRPTILTAQVEKFGGKFDVTDEARRRNRAGRVNRAMLQLANTIRRKTQQRALFELDAAVTAFSRTASGTGWATAAATAQATQVATVGPLADLTAVVKSNEVTELGYTYNLAIMNPQEWRNGVLAAGSQAAFNALFAAYGFSIWLTNRQTAGKIKWVAERMVGELGYEVPLNTETWRDKDGKQQDWFQSFVLPIVYVTDPFAILETTGHQA